MHGQGNAMNFRRGEQARRPLGPVLAALGYVAAPVRRRFGRIASIGIAGYPPDTQRRLKIVNVIAALVATTNTFYALQLAAAGDPALHASALEILSA